MNPYLIPSLRLTPKVLERLASRVEPGQVDSPTEPGRFSPREIIAHMADWEPIFLARMHQTNEQPGSGIKVYDEGEMAVAHDYAHSNLNEQLRLFGERRKATYEFLSDLDDEDLDKAAQHPERGKLTIKEQAATLLGHDLYHIEQLSGVLCPL